MLTCRLNPSIGFVIFGHQSMECRFVQNPPLPPQLYEGALNTVGIDLGVTAGGVMGWAVLSPTAGPPPGALAGEYVGASADIGMGLGAGVNVLVGGSGRSFALQPLSVEGSVALNVTLGLSGLQLRAANWTLKRQCWSAVRRIGDKDAMASISDAQRHSSTLASRLSASSADIW
jgi:Protein of unknown function (DUF992)